MVVVVVGREQKSDGERERERGEVDAAGNGRGRSSEPLTQRDFLTTTTRNKPSLSLSLSLSLPPFRHLSSLPSHPTRSPFHHDHLLSTMFPTRVLRMQATRPYFRPAPVCFFFFLPTVAWQAPW